MGEKKFTLLELHLDGDTQFGPRVLPDLFSNGEEVAGDDDIETEGPGTSPHEASTGEEADEGRGVVPLVVGVIAMVAIAVAVRRYRRDDTETESIEERDVVVN